MPPKKAKKTKKQIEEEKSKLPQNITFIFSPNDGAIINII
jgi:hypothetical protein